MKYFLSLILVATLCLTGCHRKSNDSELAANTFVFVDDYGRTVEVPNEVHKVVSISPAVTEIMFDLGAGEMLVGRTDFCNYPEEVENIESIGGISNLNVEKVISLKPDLVISGSMVPQKSVEQLEKMGIPMVCIIEKEKFEGLYDNVARIGKVIGRQEKADAMVRELRSKVSSIDTLGKYDYGMGEPIPRPTVYYVVGFGKAGNYTAGGNTFINDIIRLAGGQNIAENISGWNFSVEALMNSNPNYIMIRQEDVEEFCNTAPYKNLMAVRLHKIIPIESGLIDVQVPRNVEAVQIISDIIHPDIEIKRY